MSDRELLELAAKADGMPPPLDEYGIFSAWVGNADSGHWWDPLTDDGDALRLAVALKFSIERYDNVVLVEGIEQEWSGNWSVDTRRAIVRAAAEIGRAMP